MAGMHRRRFSESTDVRKGKGAQIEVVEMDDRVVGRTTYEPGWRWSVDMQPVAATQTCQFHHLGVVLSGRLRLQMYDGVELELGPGDVYNIPPGHDAWVVGDEPWVGVDFEAMRTFGRAEADSGRRILSTILFTDIVDSTSHAVAHGDAVWRDIVGRHNEIAERSVDRYGGRLIKTTGDGIIAMFDSAQAAVRAARAVGEAVNELEIAIRAAVHTGEVELSRDDVRGVTVHAAARMMSFAGSGEVVVSATVRDLLDGTDLAFEDFGVHALKGLPGERQLYRLSSE